MRSYIVLIRGINVGGKNPVSMATLRTYLEELGFEKVSTYIASGNIILKSDKKPLAIKAIIEEMLPKKFKLNDELIKVLVLSHKELETVIKNKPTNFGNDPKKYYSDAIFLIDVPVDEAMKIFTPREGVDKVWPGKGVIYSQRLGAERTKSRLSNIMKFPIYKSMTIRSWKTTTKLLELLEKA